MATFLDLVLAAFQTAFAGMVDAMRPQLQRIAEQAQAGGPRESVLDRFVEFDDTLWRLQQRYVGVPRSE